MDAMQIGKYAIMSDPAIHVSAALLPRMATRAQLQSHHLLRVQAHRSACEKLRLVHVADGLAALSAHAQQDLPSLLAMLCPALCAAFFPRYSTNPLCVHAELLLRRMGRLVCCKLLTT